MVEKQMKTFTAGDTKYIINDAEARTAVADLKNKMAGIEPGLSNDAKIALLNCFQHVAWIDEYGQDYYNVLENALHPEIIGLRASLNLGNHEVYPTDNIESLRNYLTVTLLEESGVEPTIITNYTMRGSISTIGDNYVRIMYDEYSVTVEVPVVVNTKGLLYEWDFTKSLTDERQCYTAILKTGEADEVPGKSEGTTPPVRGDTGVIFNNAQQVLRLLNSDVDSSALLFGKTIQVDVAEFDWAYTIQDNAARSRFITFGDPAGCSGDMLYATGFGFRKTSKSDLFTWQVFVEDRTDGPVSTTLYDTDAIMFTGQNAISGHTIGMYINNSGTVKIYMDGTSQGTSKLTYPNDLVGLQIGSGGRPQWGGSFYNARITGVRIYDGDVAQ